MADAIAQDTDTEAGTKNVAKAHAEAFRSGGIRGPAALEMMKELQARQMRDQMMKKIQGVQPDLFRNLFTRKSFCLDIVRQTKAQRYIAVVLVDQNCSMDMLIMQQHVDESICRNSSNS